jgi:hypothetical protein
MVALEALMVALEALMVALEALLTVTIMTATAVGLSRESFFLGAAGSMILLRRRSFSARDRINIDGAELFPTLPAPGTATPGAHGECARRLEATGENIVTGSIFQCPALTPRTLFCVSCHLV